MDMHVLGAKFETDERKRETKHVRAKLNIASMITMNHVTICVTLKLYSVRFEDHMAVIVKHTVFWAGT
jgi:hypothetical protein